MKKNQRTRLQRAINRLVNESCILARLKKVGFYTGRVTASQFERQEGDVRKAQANLRRVLDDLTEAP